MPFDSADIGTPAATPACFLDLLERVTGGPPAQAAMFMDERFYTQRKPKAPPPPVSILTMHVTIHGAWGDITWREYTAVQPRSALLLDDGHTVQTKQLPPSLDTDGHGDEVSDDWAGAAAIEELADLRTSLMVGLAAALDGPPWLTLDLLWRWHAGLTPTEMAREGLTPLRCPKAIRAQLRAAAERFAVAARARRASPGAIAAAQRTVAAEATPMWSTEAKNRRIIVAMVRRQRALLDARAAERARAEIYFENTPLSEGVSPLQ